MAEPLAIPAGFLYHTVPVLAGEGEGRFVTVAFHNMDDMKASVEPGQEGNLQYGGEARGRTLGWDSIRLGLGLGMGLGLGLACDPPGHTIASLRLPTTTFPEPPGPTSLWSARLFPARGSMAASLAATAGLVSSLADPSASAMVEERRYSMEQLVESKDGAAMIAFRQRLAALCRD
jgi:hypothetical protein